MAKTSSANKLTAAVRTETGKGASRRARRSGKVPVVLYGHGSEPQHLELDAHDFSAVLRHSGTNAVLTLDIEGKEQLALTKALEIHPIRRSIQHVDLLVVRRGEKVTVEIGVHLVGEAAPDTFVTTDLNSLSVEAEATNIPTGVDVSIEGLQVGAQIHAKDVTLPDGVTLVTDPEALVVNVTAATTAEEIEAELAEAEAEVGIVHEATDEEQAAQAEAAAEGGDESAAAAGGDAEGDKADS